MEAPSYHVNFLVLTFVFTLLENLAKNSFSCAGIFIEPPFFK